MSQHKYSRGPVLGRGHGLLCAARSVEPGRARQWVRRIVADLGGEVTGGDGGVQLAPTIPLRSVFRRFWPYARVHRGLIVAALVLAILSAALAAISIGFFKILVDRVLVPRDLAAFWWVALGYTCLTLLAGAISFGRRVLGALAGERFVLDLRRAVFDQLQALSLHFFEQRRLGDLVARMTGDINTIERLVVSGVFRGAAYLLRIVFFTAALFYLQWQLATAALIAVPAFGLLSRSFSARIKQATREQVRRSGAVSAVAQESLANLPLVQAYNRQDTEARRLDEQNVARFHARMTTTRLRATFSPLVDVVELAGTLIVAGLGTYELAAGNLSLGGLLAFAAYLSQLYRPVRRLASLANTAYAAAASAERVVELLDQRPAVRDAAHARPLPRVRGRVCFDDVTFRYPGASSAAIHGLSFTAEPGQKVALVGASGAGKSSAIKLLLRFYDPDSGAVRIDGRDIRTVTIPSLRENISVLLQESLIFDGTIEENIAYGRPGCTSAQVRRAVRESGLDEVIAALPDGLDTVVGQRGRRLSGGQRQRVAIARALVRRAPVLVLDEPTTGLDASSAERVLAPLRTLMSQRTTLMISHSLAAVRDADTVLVLDGGRLRAAGDHDSLIATTDYYQRLHPSVPRSPEVIGR